jgi:hypothetical protein
MVKNYQLEISIGKMNIYKKIMKRFVIKIKNSIMQKYRKKIENNLLQKKANNENKTVCDEIELEKAKYIVKYYLQGDRTEKYLPLIQLGWCLHNIDDSLLEDWDNFSQCSKKYKAGECDSRLWYHMEDRGQSMGSLIKWAK